MNTTKTRTPRPRRTGSRQVSVWLTREQAKAIVIASELQRRPQGQFLVVTAVSRAEQVIEEAKQLSRQPRERDLSGVDGGREMSAWFGPEDLALVRRAAGLQGRSVSYFVALAAAEAAAYVVDGRYDT